MPMEEIQLAFGQDPVPTFIGDDCFMDMQLKLKALTPVPDKLFVCTEQAIFDKYGSPLFDECCLGLPVHVITMENGEANKSMESLTSMTDKCFANGVSKRSVIIAFGGGIVLNVVGLMAALIYRGIRLVHVPTTLMAMHDVITSIKTAINLCDRKNNFGTYYPSILNMVDVSFCRGLNQGQYWSGMGELCKNALLLGGEHAQAFRHCMTEWRYNGADLHDQNLALVKIGIKAKAHYLVIDPKEKTTAMIFEYGHTTAHALERSYPDEVLPHGVAVCWGMLACSYVAEKMGLMTAEDRKEHDSIIELMDNKLPTPLPSMEQVMDKIMNDNKRGIVMEGPDEISEVFLHKVGEPVQSKSMLHACKVELFKEWLALQGLKSGEWKPERARS